MLTVHVLYRPVYFVPMSFHSKLGSNRTQQKWTQRTTQIQWLADAVCVRAESSSSNRTRWLTNNRSRVQFKEELVVPVRMFSYTRPAWQLDLYLRVCYGPYGAVCITRRPLRAISPRKIFVECMLASIDAQLNWAVCYTILSSKLTADKLSETSNCSLDEHR